VGCTSESFSAFPSQENQESWWDMAFTFQYSMKLWSSKLISEKSDSTVLIPGNVVAKPPQKFTNRGYASSRENHDVRWSRLFMYEEPESSVRCRSSCLRSEVRSFYILHGTLSCGRCIRYEILVPCDLEIFVALRLCVDCIIFFNERF